MNEPDDLLRQLRTEIEPDRAAYGCAGFGIIQSAGGVPLGSAAWSYLGRLRATYMAENVIFQGKVDGWTDPCPDGTWCIRWWGDHRTVDAFKPWADRVSGLLRQFPGFIPEQPVSREYYGTICAFASLAMRTHELKPLVSRRTILDGNAVDTFLFNHVPSCRKTDAPPPKETGPYISNLLEEIKKRESDSGMSLIVRKNASSSRTKGAATFTIFDLNVDAFSFAAAVIDHLLGRPRRHKMSVDVEREQVTLDGIIYKVTREQVLILDVLLKADGEVRSSGDIRRTWRELESDGHLDRRIASLKKEFPQIGDLIKPVKKTGYRLDLTWKAEEPG